MNETEILPTKRKRGHRHLPMAHLRGGQPGGVRAVLLGLRPLRDPLSLRHFLHQHRPHAAAL